MELNFSQRIGLKPIRSALQVASVDGDLRMALWNAFYSGYCSRAALYSVELRPQSMFHGLWRDLFHLPIDEFPDLASQLDAELRFRFNQFDWNEVYEFVEFVYCNDPLATRERFRSECQTEMERYMAGYRFVGGLIAPITDEVELSEIESAREAVSDSGLGGARKHLDTAAAFLSDRVNPDYRNSIKESISAVESLLKIIAGDDSLTLGQALSRIGSKGILRLKPLLRQALDKLYAYTNDQEGVRHALLDEADVEFSEAKFMLVVASAAVNLLVLESERAGLALHRVGAS